jgi:hypothetical protein
MNLTTLKNKIVTNCEGKWYKWRMGKFVLSRKPCYTGVLEFINEKENHYVPVGKSTRLFRLRSSIPFD